MVQNSRKADKFVIRFPDGLRERLNTLAKEEYISMNTLAVRAIERELLRPTPGIPLVVGMIVKYRVRPEDPFTIGEFAGVKHLDGVCQVYIDNGRNRVSYAFGDVEIQPVTI